MPDYLSDYEETLLLAGTCGAQLRLIAGAPAYRAHPLTGDKPHYAPDTLARVRHIKIEVRLDFEAKAISGTCSTTLSPVVDGLDRVEFDAVELDVESASVDGRASSFDLSDDKLRIRLPEPANAGQELVVTVRYSAQPRRGLYFTAPDDAYPHKPVQAWTQGQDEDSRHWFPCYDFPNQKSTSEVIATVPDAFFALSNGALVDTHHDPSGGTKTYHWLQEVPHSCYLISLTVGDFAEVTDDAGGVPVQYYVQRGREDDARRTLGQTPDMIRFFARKLGVAYPYNKYAQVFVADFIFGGMENTTATTLTDTALLDERASIDYDMESLVAHELAHQWFGDLLTCREWAHGWLNEGFATYFDALYKEHHKGEDEFRYWMLGEASTYFSEDPGSYRRPIVSNVYHEPIDLFDRHLYEKGALVLHMVRYLLGDEQWWQAMHHYVVKHREQNVVTLDLQRAIEEATGHNLDWFFDQWVYRAGYPEFKLEYAWDDEQKTAKLNVNQTQSNDENTPVFRMPFDVEFSLASGTETRRFEVAEREHVFYVPLAEKPQAVRFDPHGWVLKKVEFKRSRDLLLHQLRHATDAVGRVDAARDLGKEGSPQAVEALGEALHDDGFWGVQVEAARALGSIKSAAALQMLLGATSLAHPKARRAVITALGEFRDNAAAGAVAEVLARGDASCFVEAEAALSLGKTRSSQALAALEQALTRDSYGEVIRQRALDGLAELGYEGGVPLATEWSRYGRPQPSRGAAATALGKLSNRAGAGAKDDIRDTLTRLLDDPWLRVKLSAIGGLEELKDPKAIGDLERVAQRDLDGRVQRRARVAARAIREGADKGDEVRKLRDDLDGLLKENRELKDRLEKIEARLNGGGPAGGSG